MYQVKIMLPIHGFSEQDPLSTTHSDKENIARIANAVQSTLKYHVTKIIMNSGSQLLEL